MGTLMDLVAGDPREILLVLSLDDVDAFADRGRFDAHLSLGAGLDPTWLDLFSESCRTVCNQPDPRDFFDARHDLGPAVSERNVERVDPAWIDAVARLNDHDLDAITGRWIDLLADDLGDLSPEEKPWIRELAAQIVGFCRAADRSPAVLFAWSL